MSDRRNKTWREIAARTPSAGEALQDSEQGAAPVPMSEIRCRVCKATDLSLPNAADVAWRVNTLLPRGLSYKAILEHIKPLMERWPKKNLITYDSIRNHQKRHLPVDELAVREVLERRAATKRKQLLRQDHPLLTQEGVLEVVVQVGLQALVRGDITPKVSDVVSAIATLNALEEKNSGTDQKAYEQLRKDLQLITQAVRESVPPDMWTSITTRLDELAQTQPDQTISDKQQERGAQ